MNATAEIIALGNSPETYREAAARRIKQLMHDWVANTMALAKELAAVRETFQPSPKRPDHRPGFQKWARAETGLSQGAVSSLIRIHDKFGHQQGLDDRLGSAVLKLLAQRNVPEAARQEAIKRAQSGVHVTYTDAKKIVKVNKLPRPKEANQQARDEGRPVLASDGYIYFGTDAGRAKEGEDRRTMVYGVRKALDTLGNIHLTGHQFLLYALPHQLWDADEAKIIKRALRWLTSLDEAWDRRD